MTTWYVYSHLLPNIGEIYYICKLNSWHIITKRIFPFTISASNPSEGGWWLVCRALWTPCWKRGQHLASFMSVSCFWTLIPQSKTYSAPSCWRSPCPPWGRQSLHTPPGAPWSWVFLLLLPALASRALHPADILASSGLHQFWMNPL